jgi:phage terminase large subunit-like protein
MPRQRELTNGEALFKLAADLKASSLAPNVFRYDPHDKQRVFHTSTCKKKLYIGGNRSGKTTGGIVEDIWWLTGRHPFRTTPAGPIRGRVVSVDFVNGIEKIILPQFKQWLPASDLIDGSWEKSYDKLLRTLTLANGSFVEFMSYDQDLDKFAGTSRHFIHFDEEPPQDIFIECTARLVDTGGSYWITMTPVEGMTWVYDVLYEPGIAEENDISVVEVSMEENPYLNLEAVRDFLDGLDEDERKARGEGKFVQLGGLIYKHFSKTTHTRPGGWTPPADEDWLVIASLDHGFANPTAWLWHAVNPDGEVVTFYEHYQSGWTVDSHAARVLSINREVLGRTPDLYIGDPSIRNTDPISGTSIHLEYVKFGIPIVLGNNDVRAGINRVARYLKVNAVTKRPRWVITEDCPNLIKEMGRYRWATYASKKVGNDNNLKEEPHKKFDHACDSARYFFMSRPDLAAETLDKTTPHNAVGAVTVSSQPLRAEPNQAPTRIGDYGDAEGTQWSYDELGSVW